MACTDLSSSGFSATATLDAYLSRGSDQRSSIKGCSCAGLKREQSERSPERGLCGRYSSGAGDGAERNLGETVKILRMIDDKGGGECREARGLWVSERLERIKRELGVERRTGSPGKLLGELTLEKDLNFAEASKRVRCKGGLGERGSSSEVRDSARTWWCKERDNKGSSNMHQETRERNNNWAPKSSMLKRGAWGGEGCVWGSEEGLTEGWSSSGELQSRLEALRQKASDRLLPGDKNKFRSGVISPRCDLKSSLRWNSARIRGKEIVDVVGYSDAESGMMGDVCDQVLNQQGLQIPRVRTPVV